MTTPNPLALPVATTSQSPLTAAYDALNVPGLAAGQTYLDPTTGVKVYRLTSSTFPTANSTGWRHDYAEGNNEVSLPHTGETRTILCRVATYGDFWLFDFTPGTGVSNPRKLVAPLAPGGATRDQEFTFANYVGWPYYAYIANGTDIVRVDVRNTPSQVNGDGWPVAGEGDCTWLQQAQRDEFFGWMRNPAPGNTCVGYEPGTATKKVYTGANASLINEPRLDRGSNRFVGFTLNPPDVNALQGWAWVTDTAVFHQSAPPPFAHGADLQGRIYTSDFNAAFPDYFVTWDTNAYTFTNLSGPSVSAQYFGSGMWPQPAAALDDQWAIFTHYGSLSPIITFGDFGWLAPGAMVFITANGQRRILAHPYNTTATYEFLSFPKLAPDGLYVLFTSDMNGSARSDLFLAEVPVIADVGVRPASGGGRVIRSRHSRWR